jgi:hypothetical protein
VLVGASSVQSHPRSHRDPPWWRVFGLSIQWTPVNGNCSRRHSLRGAETPTRTTSPSLSPPRLLNAHLSKVSVPGRRLFLVVDEMACNVVMPIHDRQSTAWNHPSSPCGDKWTCTGSTGLPTPCRDTLDLRVTRCIALARRSRNARGQVRTTTHDTHASRQLPLQVSSRGMYGVDSLADVVQSPRQTPKQAWEIDDDWAAREGRSRAFPRIRELECRTAGCSCRPRQSFFHRPRPWDHCSSLHSFSKLPPDSGVWAW